MLRVRGLSGVLRRIKGEVTRAAMARAENLSLPEADVLNRPEPRPSDRPSRPPKSATGLREWDDRCQDQ